MHLVEIILGLLEPDRLDRREVVGPATLVEESHGAIALEVGHRVWAHGLVDRELLVVDADTVSVCVRVREETGLKDWVGRGLNAGHHVRGVERDLLDLGKVVGGILVEGELADGAERVVFVRPDVGEIKDVDALLLPGFLGLLLSHRLDLHGPRGEVAVLDGVVEVFLTVVVGAADQSLAHWFDQRTHHSAASSAVRFLIPWSEMRWNWA